MLMPERERCEGEKFSEIVGPSVVFMVLHRQA